MPPQGTSITASIAGRRARRPWPAIAVSDLHKTFRVPTRRIDSLKERAVHPFASREYRELGALRGISFEVARGEFFGILGRNGSGKSTLLKLLASIYKADRGTIEIDGRLAPFIELGVGFNHELTARQNVVLNGVMMGLTAKEMRRRSGAVIDFAELGDFAELKLKNYSSGMLVRLAFALMMEADADVLLIDEVLAVGDASFQQKCADAFHRMKAEGKTIVLVTHDMAAVETYCHRAMLLAEGRIACLGEPAEVARSYLRLNLAGEPAAGEAAGPGAAERGRPAGVRLLDCRIEDGAGEETSGVELGQPLRLRAEIELAARASALQVGFGLSNADGLSLLEFGTTVTAAEGELRAGARVTVTATVENPLACGRHLLHCGIQSPEGIDIYVPDAARFVVFGSAPARGVIAPHYEFCSRVEAGEGR